VWRSDVDWFVHVWFASVSVVGPLRNLFSVQSSLRDGPKSKWRMSHVRNGISRNNASNLNRPVLQLRSTIATLPPFIRLCYYFACAGLKSSTYSEFNECGAYFSICRPWIRFFNVLVQISIGKCHKATPTRICLNVFLLFKLFEQTIRIDWNYCYNVVLMGFVG
jgi:hypothetical protein